MAIVFTCGGENNSLTDWTASDVAACDGTYKRSGSYGIRINTTGGSTGYTSWTFSANQTMVVARVSLYANSFQDLATILDFYIQNATYNVVLRYRNSDGKLLYGYQGSEAASTNAVSTGTWYTLDFKIDVSANPWVMDWKIDGVSQTQATASLAADNVQRFRLGSAAAASSYDIAYDDSAVSFTSGDYPIPNGSSLGSPESWTTGGGGRYLLESSSVDGYQKEDASGVLLLEAAYAESTSLTLTANQPTVIASVGTTADAGNAAATLTANQPSASSSTNAGASSLSITAQQPTGEGKPNAGAASVGLTANQPTGGISANSGSSSLSISAQQPAASPSANAEVAAISLVANQPTVTTTGGGSTTASAGAATISVYAEWPDELVGPDWSEGFQSGTTSSGPRAHITPNSGDTSISVSATGVTFARRDDGGRGRPAWQGPMVRSESVVASAGEASISIAANQPTTISFFDEANFLLGLTDEGLVFGVC